MPCILTQLSVTYMKEESDKISGVDAYTISKSKKLRSYSISAIRYTLDKSHNIKFILFISLENISVLIVLKIMMYPSQKMKNVFIVRRR